MPPKIVHWCPLRGTFCIQLMASCQNNFRSCCCERLHIRFWCPTLQLKRMSTLISSVPWKRKVNCNGRKMRLDWILVRISLNFHFLASKWHLIASKYPKFAVPWKWRFPARPFCSQMQWAKNEIGLDSSQNLSKISISSLNMALSGL